MDSITLVFGSGNSPFSWLVKLFTGSQWSHVGVLTGTHVIEAVVGKGVIKTPLAEFTSRYSEWRMAELPVRDKALATRRVRAELGKPYDLTALFGILFRRAWHDTDKWFCSELVAHASGMFRKTLVKRITPEAVWRITY